MSRIIVRDPAEKGYYVEAYPEEGVKSKIIDVRRLLRDAVLTAKGHVIDHPKDLVLVTKVRKVVKRG